MRASPAGRSLALALLAALLAACQVDVDGAPCAVPGATTDCPGGQACGNDLRCSARALACAASRCAPGTGGDCLDPTGLASGTARAHFCSDRDPVCGLWVVEDCAGEGLLCGRHPDARCECPPYAGRVLHLLPGGSPVAAAPFATGAGSPPACAFATLTDAVASARVRYLADPSSVVTVAVAGVPAGATRTFSAGTGERFPLILYGTVLSSDGPAGGGSYEIVYERPGAGSAPVWLRGVGPGLQGFTIRNGNGSADNSAIMITCSSTTAPARLAAVVLDGLGASGAQLGTGINGSFGGCALVAEDVQVRNFAGVGVDWEGTTGAPLTLRNGAVTANGGAGILASTGRVLLDGARVAGNRGRGVDATAALEVRGSRIVQNGDTGIAVRGAGEVRISRTTVFGNGAATAFSASPSASGVARRGGGVVLSGVPPPAGSFELWGNRIYANGGDQVLLLGPPTANWIIDGPPACTDAQGPLGNLIGCYDPTPAGTAVPYRGVVAVDAGGSAQNQWWQRGVPSPDLDVAQLPTGWAVPVGVTCGWSAPPLDCGSENPPP